MRRTTQEQRSLAANIMADLQPVEGVHWQRVRLDGRWFVLGCRRGRFYFWECSRDGLSDIRNVVAAATTASACAADLAAEVLQWRKRLPVERHRLLSQSEAEAQTIRQWTALLADLRREAQS